MVLVCHVNSKDHVIKDSCDFSGRSPTCQFWWPKALVVEILKLLQIQ